MINNKRGIGVNWLLWIVLFLILIPFFILLDGALDTIVAQTVDTHGFESDILYARLFSSSNSIFRYERDIERMYSGQIRAEDIDVKFTEENLNSLFDKEANLKLAFKLELRGKGLEKIIYFNKNLFELGESESRVKESRFSLVENSIPVSILGSDGSTDIASLKISRIISE